MNEYMKIPINLIDPNPHQIREKHDEDMIAGIAISAVKSRHGILQSPMVRMKKDGRFETVYGHGRIRAAKAAGFTELECRVEKDVTDDEMTLYMGQENVLRSDLNEKERMAWLEQVRKNEGIELDDADFLEKLTQETGLSATSLKRHYWVKEARDRLGCRPRTQDLEIPRVLILRTLGIDPEIQDSIITKVVDKGWSADTAFKIKVAVTDIDPELRAKLLDEKNDLPWKVIVALSGIENVENAKKILYYILRRRLTEKSSLTIIEDAKQGIYPTYNITYSNQFEDTLRSFRIVNMTITGWGKKKYEIVKDHWDVIDPILTNIETKIEEFRRLNRRVQ